MMNNKLAKYASTFRIMCSIALNKLMELRWTPLPSLTLKRQEFPLVSPNNSSQAELRVSEINYMVKRNNKFAQR